MVSRLIALALAAAVVAGLAVPAAAQTATLSSDAWWNRAAVGLPVPSPSTVPEGAVAVGATSGEPDKLAAVAIDVRVPSGTRITRLELAMGELALRGTSAIRACPATQQWEPVKNGQWSRVPTRDCDLFAVEGQRAEAQPDSGGTGPEWTFDLTALGRQWADGTLAPYGVVLEESVTPPASFELSLADTASGKSRVTLEIDRSSAGATGAPAEGPAPAPGSGGGPSASATTSAGAGDGPPSTAAPAAPLSPSAPRPAAATPTTAGPRPAPGAPAGGATPTSTPPTTAPAAGGSAPAADLPPLAATGFPWAVLLLVPVALALAVVTALVLGPAGQPVSSTRQGGVSRALAKRGGSPRPSLEAP